MKHEFDNGKYAVEQTADYKLLAYRHGELWQDLTGNNLVYWMLCEIDKLKEQRSEMLASLKMIDQLNPPIPLGVIEGAQAAISKAEADR